MYFSAWEEKENAKENIYTLVLTSVKSNKIM